MACHILHPVFKALQLGYPTKVQGSSTALLTDCAPQAQMVTYVFPARGKKDKVKLPEVTVTWYDGGLTPPRPEGLEPGKSLNDQGGGAIFYGTKDILVCGCYGVNPYLVSGREPKVPARARKVELSHGKDWVRACKESKENRTLTNSDFSEAGPFNEMVVMGVLAVRLSGLQGLHRELQWDGENMRFTNISPNDKIKIVTVDDFKVIDGDPRFDRRFAEFNAAEMANEWIKHTYNNGFSLPDMPR